MADRTFTAHIEKADGSYTSVPVYASSYSEAWNAARQNLSDGDTLSGVTETTGIEVI